MPMKSKSRLPVGGYARTINERRGATRRSSESLWKSERHRDVTEAFGEACLARAWDAAPAVRKFELQIPPFTYEHEGVYRKTYPDGQAWLQDGSTIVREVKPGNARYDVALQDRYAAIAREYASHDVSFKLVYSDDLMLLPRRHNIDLLLRARETPASPEEARKAGKLVCDRGRISIMELRALFGFSWFEALSLVPAGICHIDLNSTFSPAIELHAADVGEFNFCL